MERREGREERTEEAWEGGNCWYSNQDPLKQHLAPIMCSAYLEDDLVMQVYQYTHKPWRRMLTHTHCGVELEAAHVRTGVHWSVFRVPGNVEFQLQRKQYNNLIHK